MPAPVEEKRTAVLAAAESGDADAVAALAGEQFSYTFGGPVEGGAAAYWRELEENGGQPLEALAAILRLPYTLSRGLYVWPFAYDATQDELTQYETELLKRVPEAPETIGPEGYLGWRAGIAPDGEWLFFVAGD